MVQNVSSAIKSTRECYDQFSLHGLPLHVQNEQIQSPNKRAGSLHV